MYPLPKCGGIQIIIAESLHFFILQNKHFYRNTIDYFCFQSILVVKTNSDLEYRTYLLKIRV